MLRRKFGHPVQGPLFKCFSLSLLLALAACGGGGGSSTEATTSTMTVVVTNAAPTVALQNLDQGAEVDTPFEYDAAQGGTTFTDPDGDALTYGVTLNPDNAGLTATGAVISGTPNRAATVTATITATDPSGAEASDTFSIIIQEDQDVMARSGLAGLRFHIGQVESFDPADWARFFEDPSGNGLTLSIELATAIPGMSLNGGVLSGTPTTAGTFAATVIASNSAGDDAEVGISIVVLRSTTVGAPLLPADVFDYVAYAEEDTPLHFRDGGNNSIASTDNTPNNNALTNAGATLGRVLFYDTRLSIDNSVSCASCHVQAFNFGEPTAVSTGFDGQRTPVNAPSLANVRFYARGNMFWDERADSLEDQALGPIQSDVEMGNTLANMVATVEAQSFYPPLFEAAFGDDAVTANRVARALAQFQRAMVSYQSRFDTAVIGDNPNANTPDYAGLLTQEELHGMALFQPVNDNILAQGGLDSIDDIGCAQCHQTMAQVLDRAPQNIGLDPTVSGNGASGDDDFKVPSLRNIAQSAPYMHDGRFETLEEVVIFYAQEVNDNGETSNLLREGDDAGAPIERHDLSDEDIAALVAFMQALSDDSFLTDAAFSDPFTE